MPYFKEPTYRSERTKPERTRSPEYKQEVPKDADVAALGLYIGFNVAVGAVELVADGVFYCHDYVQVKIDEKRERVREVYRDGSEDMKVARDTMLTREDDMLAVATQRGRKIPEQKSTSVDTVKHSQKNFTGPQLVGASVGGGATALMLDRAAAAGNAMIKSNAYRPVANLQKDGKGGREVDKQSNM